MLLFLIAFKAFWPICGPVRRQRLWRRHGPIPRLIPSPCFDRAGALIGWGRNA